MNECGDTLSNQTVLVLPTDSILGFDNTWVDSTGEGALENGRLWIHPFRSNQYIFTEMTLPVDDLTPGMYTVRITTGSAIEIKRLMKQ